MLPVSSATVWSRLVLGEKNITSNNVAVTMMLFNNRLGYKTNPSSEALSRSSAAVYEFFWKYSGVLQKEIAQLN